MHHHKYNKNRKYKNHDFGLQRDFTVRFSLVSHVGIEDFQVSWIQTEVCFVSMESLNTVFCQKSHRFPNLSLLLLEVTATK